MAFIGIDDVVDQSGLHDFTVIEPDGVVTEFQEHASIVRHAKESFSSTTKAPYALEALFLEVRISDA